MSPCPFERCAEWAESTAACRPLGVRGFLSNCFSIIQQCFVTGWGGLRSQAAFVLAPAPAVQSASLSAKRTRRARK